MVIAVMFIAAEIVEINEELLTNKTRTLEKNF